MTDLDGLEATLSFLNRIGGDGYGGMAEYEVARVAVIEAMNERKRWPGRLMNIKIDLETGKTKSHVVRVINEILKDFKA